MRLPLVLAVLLGLIPAALCAQSGPQPSVAPAPSMTPAAPTAVSGWPVLEGGGSYVLFLDKGVTLVNGTRREYERSKALRTAPDEQLFWFQRGGKELVIRDGALLQQLQALFEPTMKLGRQQAALEEKLAGLANQLEEVVVQQQEQGQIQADFVTRMSQLATEEVQLQEQGESSEAVEAEMQGLEEEQAGLAEPQADLAREQEGIEQQQALLNQQLNELRGKQQKVNQDAATQLKTLVDRAVSKGLAKPVK